MENPLGCGPAFWFWLSALPNSCRLGALWGKRLGLIYLWSLAPSTRVRGWKETGSRQNFTLSSRLESNDLKIKTNKACKPVNLLKLWIINPYFEMCMLSTFLVIILLSHSPWFLLKVPLEMPTRLCYNNRKWPGCGCVTRSVHNWIKSYKGN